MEQVNIEGKRSGEGFVSHKDTLVNALSRVLAERITLFDSEVCLGRKGLLAYLKALAGSNIVKVIPANGGASGSQAAIKAVKVICGKHQGYLPNEAWVRDKMPYTFSQIRVLPSNAIMPNLGPSELAEAFARVLPFTASDEARPVLACVKVEIGKGKLTLVSADGFRLAIASLNLDASEGEALIHRDELKGLMPALRKAKRARLAIEEKASTEGGLLAKHLIVDTELVTYRIANQEAKFPDYQQLIPQDLPTSASLDTKEAIKAIRSLLAIFYDDDLKPMYRPIILTIANGKIVMERQGEAGKAEVDAETNGEGIIAVHGRYLIEALKACGGIANLQIGICPQPMLFSSDGFQVVVMPIALKTEGKTEGEVEAEATAKAQAEAKAEAEGKPKGKAKRSKRTRKATAKTEAEAVAEAQDIDEAITEAIDELNVPIDAELVGVA